MARIFVRERHDKPWLVNLDSEFFDSMIYLAGAGVDHIRLFLLFAIASR